ncbi:MAG: hypothetical protein ACR2OH_05445 [Microthrixaceae bacterium]
MLATPVELLNYVDSRRRVRVVVRVRSAVVDMLTRVGLVVGRLVD